MIRTVIVCPWGYLFVLPELVETVMQNLSRIWPMETFIEVK
jgi:hypothetical protein